MCEPVLHRERARSDFEVCPEVLIDREGGVIRAFAPLRLGQLAGLCVGVAFAAPALAADTRQAGHVLQGRRADLPGEVPGVPSSPDSIAPMSLITYQEARPWARSIKERVATRQMPPWHIDRSVGVQKFKNDMSLTDEQIDTIVALGRSAARRRATRRTCRRPSRSSPTTTGRRERDGYGPPDLVVKSPEYTMPARAPGRVVAADERHPGHRAALGADGRDSSDQPQGPQDPASLDRVPRAEPDERRSGQHRHRRPAARAGCRRQPRRPRQPPSAADGMGDRQGLRPLPGRHRQADHAGREDLVGPAHPRGRRRDHRRLGNRHLALSERPGAEEAQLPDRLHRPQERHRRRSTSRRTRSRTPKASRC